jgi:hypothetical protein
VLHNPEAPLNAFVLFWNQVALEANRLDHTAGPGTNTGPTMSSRALAIIHIAMHDAWMGAATARHARRYDPAAPTESLPAGAWDIAVGAAARRAITRLYAARPDIVGVADAAWYAFTSPQNTPQAAVAFGVAAADHALAQRAADRDANRIDSQNGDVYADTLGEGAYSPDPLNPPSAGQPAPIHGPFYGRNALFAASTRFTLDAPSSLTPAQLAAAFEEVYKLGGAPDQPTTTRTPEQTTIGVSWAYDGVKQLGTPPRLYNQIVREFLKDDAYSVEDTIRVLAMVNVAMGDAGILAWREKYIHNYWRPVTGLRMRGPSLGTASEDLSAGGIPAGADPFWRPLGAPRTNEPPDAPNDKRVDFTPPFPAYPSGHATFGAASLRVLERFLQSKGVANTGFALVSDELDGASTHFRDGVRPRHLRRFGSLAEAIEENAVSRVYLGVHWRFDGLPPVPGQNVGGVPLGINIADDIYDSGFKRSSVPADP